MDQLAPDQTVEDSEALVASLQHNASSLTYKELQTRLALNAEAIRTLNQRCYDAAEAIDAAKADLQKQEAAFLVESGGNFNPAHLRQWREKLDATLQKAAHLRNQEARLKALSGVLSAELQKRDSRRAYLTLTKLREKHASNLEATLNKARAAIAEAICATAWSVSGLSPSDILPTLFLQNRLLEGDIREAVQRFAAAKRAEAEKQVAEDPMFGGGGK